MSRVLPIFKNMRYLIMFASSLSGKPAGPRYGDLVKNLLMRLKRAGCHLPLPSVAHSPKSDPLLVVYSTSKSLSRSTSTYALILILSLLATV